MELRHLKYFVTVVDEKSVTKAADKLCMAQPPLTRQIKTLEDELGVNLFERGTRPLKVTEAGEYFYQHAVQILTLTAHATSMVNRLKQADAVVRVGYVNSLFYWKLPQIIHLFRKCLEGTRVELIECGTRDQVEALKLGKIDMGFGRLRLNDPSVKRVLLEEEALLVAVHNEHPLVKQSHQPVFLSQLVDESIFLYPNTPRPNFSTSIQTMFSAVGLIPQHILEVREIHMALGLVSSGEGVCIIPKSASAIGIKNIVYLEIADLEAVAPICLTYRNMDHNPYIRQMLECVDEYVPRGVRY